MDEKRTCWLVLPAAAGVTWQTSGQVFKRQVCWGGASHVSPRTCYIICMWPDWMLVNAAGDEWGERGVRRRRGFGSLQSPPRTCIAWERELQDRGCAVDSEWNYIPAWVVDTSILKSLVSYGVSIHDSIRKKLHNIILKWFAIHFLGKLYFNSA